MTTQYERILVLKSNIATYSDLMQIQQPFNHHPEILKWNVDLDDCDHVIRIVSPSLTVADIEELVKSNGYQCSELE
jgi:hypothetical protein